MKIATVVIDSWKLPIFERHLFLAEMKYENVGPLEELKGPLMLKVECDFISQAQVVVEAAQKECAEKKPPDIDYMDLIVDCKRITGHGQGTYGCIAFAKGAEWYAATLLRSIAEAEEAKFKKLVEEKKGQGNVES